MRENKEEIKLKFKIKENKTKNLGCNFNTQFNLVLAQRYICRGWGNSRGGDVNLLTTVQLFLRQ